MSNPSLSGILAGVFLRARLLGRKSIFEAFSQVVRPTPPRPGMSRPDGVGTCE